MVGNFFIFESMHLSDKIRLRFFWRAFFYRKIIDNWVFVQAPWSRENEKILLSGEHLVNFVIPMNSVHHFHFVIFLQNMNIGWDPIISLNGNEDEPFMDCLWIVSSINIWIEDMNFLFLNILFQQNANLCVKEVYPWKRKRESFFIAFNRPKWKDIS